MLKYLSKITMDILPSVAATIIGAYIVNHYIAAKPATNAPVAAAVSTAAPKKVDAASADLGNIPAAGVRAKGISEKAIFEKSAAEKPVAEKPIAEKPQEKPAEKPALAEKSAEKEKPAEKSSEKSLEQPEAETASISADTRRHTPAPREKNAIRVIPLTAAAQPAVQPAASVAAPAPAPTVETAMTPEERRDANDLARAAIERLREGAPRAPETVRVPDAAPRIASVPQAPVPQAAAIRPLPPPIVVSTPPADSFGSGPSPTQPYPPTARVNDPRRPIPPADIPPAAPVDLHAAEPADASSARPHTNVAEDMLLAAKSVFHSVLPQ
jgi:hypothetical protein